MKQNLFKTMTALLCLLAMLTGALVSCGKKEPTKPDSTKTTPSTTVGNGGTEEPTEIDYTSFITKETFDYETIRILVQQNDVLQFDVGEEEPTNKVDLAFYRRNRQVEDTHEVELMFTTGDTQEDYATKLNVASMGGDSYDIVETWHWYVNKWTYFTDLQQYTDILHFENPYWASGANDNALINGKQYTAFGQGSPSVYASAMVVFYNEHLRLNYELDEFTPLVESGDWTIENMLTMMEKATVITDETANSYENKYGLGYNLWSGRALLWGCGLQLSTYTDGELNITLANETNYNIFNKVKTFLTSNNYSYYGGGGGNDKNHLFDSDKNDINAFINYKLLFDTTTLRTSEKIAQLMPNFGILPMPKLDKTQDDYITPVSGVSPFGIMKSSSDPRRAAIILETFTIYSYLTVRPEYYETALKLRYQTDANAAKMVDFIVDRLSIDFLFINGSAFESVADQPFNLIEPFGNLQGEGYYSYMGSLQNKMEGYLEQFMKVYEDAEKPAE
ncbi:MAG TPA: hypothetical protein DDW30_05480 [Clostridiales bacterium]|nr:hypothetical protein [Clostridiales bacterium]